MLSECNSYTEHVAKIIESPTGNHRDNRELINVVGGLVNVLYGFCDDAVADYFYDKIRELETSKSLCFFKRLR